MKDTLWQLLRETPMLDYSDESIQKLITNRGWKALRDQDRVKAIYGFVKDEILFGYNSSDKLSASRVLKDGYGQCNTKGTLFMALLRACGIPCRIHGFMIDKVLQKGAMTGFVYQCAPKEIFHSYVEVLVNDVWYHLEGFILDKDYLTSLQETFQPKNDGSFIGYGVATKDFLHPPIEFDCCDTYIQNEGIVQDYGVYDDPDALLKEHGQQMNAIKKIVYRWIGRRLMNRNVRRLRRKKG